MQSEERLVHTALFIRSELGNPTIEYILRPIVWVHLLEDEAGQINGPLPYNGSDTLVTFEVAALIKSGQH
jgi:hypothetical protein